MKSVDHHYDLAVPVKLVYDERVAWPAKFFYAEICALHRVGGCWKGKKAFAEDFGVSEDTIKSWQKQLSDAGWLELRIGTDNRHRLLIPVMKDRPENEDEGVRKLPLKGGENTTARGEKNTPPSRAQEELKDKEPPLVPPKKKFVIPTLPECVSEAERLGMSNVEGEKFFYHHDSKGWVIGNAKMKNWKSAMQTWKRNAARFSGIGFQRRPDNILREDRSKWTEEQWKNS